MARPLSLDDDDDFDDRLQPRSQPALDLDDYGSSRYRRQPGRGSMPAGSPIAVAIVMFMSVSLVVLFIVGVSFLKTLRKKSEVVDNTPLAPKSDGQTPGGDPNSKLPSETPTPGKMPGTGKIAGVRVPPLATAVTQLVFAGGEDGYAAIISRNPRGAGKVVDVVKTATGDVQGQVTIETSTDLGYALSPDGKWLAVVRAATSEGVPLSLYNVAEGQHVARTTPYPKLVGGDSRDLIWAGFISKDQLLTINSAGGFDRLSIPALQSTGGILGSLTPGSRLEVERTTGTPKNFALSADGKTLAIFNGSGFSFYENDTLQNSASTEPLSPSGGNIVFSGAALTANGSKFACHFRIFGSSGTIGVWNAISGKRTSLPSKSVVSPAGFAWWGAEHLLFWKGGASNAEIHNLQSGEKVGLLRTTYSGKLGTVPPSGMVWAIVGGNGNDPATGAAYLVKASVPESLPADAQIELSPEGLQTR